MAAASPTRGGTDGSPHGNGGGGGGPGAGGGGGGGGRELPPLAIGGEGKDMVHEILAAAGPGGIAQVQEACLLPHALVRHLLGMCEVLEVSRCEAHKAVLQRAKERLLGRVAALDGKSSGPGGGGGGGGGERGGGGGGGSDKARLERLLAASFTYLGMAEMREVPLAVMERLERVPAQHLKQLAADTEVFKILPPGVQRQVWEYDKNLLQADALPLVGAYKYETATYMRCLALDEFLPAVLAAGRRLALQLLSQGPASSGEGAAAGAGGDRDPDSLTGIGGKGGKGGAARGPRGAGAAAAAAAAGVGGAHMLGPGALGGGGPGGGGGPVGGGGITRKILRKGSRITQALKGMVGSSPKMLRHWLRDPRPTLATAVAIDPSEIHVDVHPLRKLDGTFEPGEGTYRGARVKLVVAVELMAPAVPPRPPAAASTAAATGPSTVASPMFAAMSTGLNLGGGGGGGGYGGSSTGMVLPYGHWNGMSGSASANGYMPPGNGLAAARAVSSGGGSSSGASPVPTVISALSAAPGRVTVAAPPFRPATPLSNRASGLGMATGAPQPPSPPSGTRSHLLSSAVAAAMAAAGASSVGGGSAQTLTRQLSEMEMSVASGDGPVPPAAAAAASGDEAEATIAACNKLLVGRSSPIGIPRPLPSPTTTAPLPATSPNPSPLLRLDDAADGVLPTSPFGRLPPGSHGGLGSILTGASPRMHGPSNATIPDSATAMAATARSSNNGFGKKPSGHMEQTLQQDQASFFDLDRASNRGFGLSGSAAAGGGGGGSVTGGGGWTVTRKLRKHVSSLLWRAFRLQHPAMCPILGIVWEWPLNGPGTSNGAGGTANGALSRIPETSVSKGIASPFRTANSSAGAGLAGTGGAGSGGAAATSGSLTVPVIVRQWYELGDLSLLLENSTVPLPLLTKSNIVRGIAEAVTYLHAQEPPIVVGPLHASRVLLDRNFHPHLFLRLSSLDPTYGSQPHQQRLMQAHQQQLQTMEAAQTHTQQQQSQQQRQQQYQQQQQLSQQLSQAHSLASPHAASNSGHGSTARRTLMGIKLAAVTGGFKRVTAGTEDVTSSGSPLPQPPTPVLQTESHLQNQLLLLPQQQAQQQRLALRSFAFDPAVATAAAAAATASLAAPAAMPLPPTPPTPSTKSVAPLLFDGAAAPPGPARDSALMLTSAAAVSEAGLQPTDSGEVHLTMPSIMAPSCPQRQLVVVDTTDTGALPLGAGVADGAGLGAGAAIGMAVASGLASAPTGCAAGVPGSGTRPFGLSGIVTGVSGRLMLPSRVAPSAGVGGDNSGTHTVAHTPTLAGAPAAAGTPPPPMHVPPPPYIPSCAQDVYEFGQLLCRIFVVHTDTPDTSRDQLLRISAAFDRDSLSDGAVGRGDAGGGGAGGGGGTGHGAGGALPLAFGSGSGGRNRSGAPPPSGAAPTVPARSPFNPSGRAPAGSGRASPAALPTEPPLTQQQLQQLLPVASTSIGDNNNLSRASSGLSNMGLQLATGSRGGGITTATAASPFPLQQQATQAISVDSPESIDEVLEALYEVCPELSELAGSCMHPDPAQRPSFPQVLFTFENIVRPALLSGTLGISGLEGMGPDSAGGWGDDDGGCSSPLTQPHHAHTTHHAHASSATRSMAQALGLSMAEGGAAGGGGGGDVCGDSSVSGRTTNDGGVGGTLPRSSGPRRDSSNHHGAAAGAGAGMGAGAGAAAAGGVGPTRPNPFFSNISHAFQSVAKGHSKPPPSSCSGAAAPMNASAPTAPGVQATGGLMAAARQHLRHRGSQRAASNPAGPASHGNMALPPVPQLTAPGEAGGFGATAGPPPAVAAVAAASMLVGRCSGSFTQQPQRHVPARTGLLGAGPDLGVGRMGHVAAADDFLFDFFPPKVARSLLMGETPQPERFEVVSIYFSDVVGYTDLCAQLQPYEVMDLMHRLYSQLDAIIQAMALFKVETVGDAYLAVSNLRLPQPDTHARLLAQFAFEAVRAATSTPIHPERPELGCVTIRVGLHCGPVVGSVVGMLNRRYCLFGDSVNTAARMEHNSEPNRVHCSGAFAGLIAEQWPGARVISRGVRNIKGKGPMETFWIEEPPASSQAQHEERSEAQQAQQLAKQPLVGRTGRLSMHMPRSSMPRSRSNQELAKMEMLHPHASMVGAGGGGTGSASREAAVAPGSHTNVRPNSGGRGLSLVATLRKSREWRRGSVDKESRGFAFPSSKPLFP